jgi:hypothetical protein
VDSNKIDASGVIGYCPGCPPLFQTKTLGLAILTGRDHPSTVLPIKKRDDDVSYNRVDRVDSRQ